MKTKIIYISGSEVFDMADIRAAFEEVRMALNLDKNTVLFGVPVDNDDAGLAAETPTTEQAMQNIIEDKITNIDFPSSISAIAPSEDEVEEAEVEEIKEVEEEEEVVVEPVKKRGRPRKVQITAEDLKEDEETIEDEVEEEQVEDEIEEVKEDKDDKVIPIISILSNNEDEEESTEEIVDEVEEETSEDDIIDEEITDLSEAKEVIDETVEPDLEKLLSGIAPLEEDLTTEVKDEAQEPLAEEEETENVDATLEKLATEYAQAQDKISITPKGTKKIETFLSPFKKKKQKDTGLGDLFGWAGYAANDEEFAMPGFFTKKNSKK